MKRDKRDAVIVGAVRSPIGKREKALSSLRPDEMAAQVLNALVERVGIPHGDVEDIVMGCSTPTGEQGFNVARLSALIAGFPPQVPATTVNRMCASGDQSLQFASQAIRSGDMDIVIAAGVESMSRVPMGSDGAKFSRKLRDRYRMIPQGISAEMVAEKWGLSRKDLDEYSMESHRRACDAQERKFFDREIVPLTLQQNGQEVLFEEDEGPRSDTSLEKMAALEPVFQEGGRVTAGNSSQMSDGAAALLLMAREKAQALDLKPRARIYATAVVGDDPIYQLTGVIKVTQKILDRAGLDLKDMDLIEVNEAFASIVLAWAREWRPDLKKMNTRGGGISLGHPLGATGARIATTLLHALEDTEGQFGLQTMCIGHGMANATILELED